MVVHKYMKFATVLKDLLSIFTRRQFSAFYSRERSVYLVLSVFNCGPISSLVTNNASFFIYILHTFSNILTQSA